MTRLFLLVSTLASLASFAADAPRKLAFERNGAIWVANLDGTGARKLLAGSDPDLSPDGMRVAFTINDPSGKTPNRSLGLADVATGKRTVLKDVPSENCYGPVWSPDGTKLIFNIYADNDWHLGLVNADGSGFRFLKKAATKGHSFYDAAWAPDGQSFFCQDMEAIHRFGLDGALIKKWNLHALVANGDMNSGSQLALSPDGATLLIELDMDEEHHRKNWDGPPPAIWALDLATDKATRLTPKGFFAWQPRWLSASEYLFISQAANESEPSIYRAALGGKERKLVLKKARTPSVSR